MRDVYTPSELNREVRLHLEAGFPRVWVEGEISNLSRPASGHLYFTLKDERAEIRCALFRSDAQRLTFKPENGLLVQTRGRLSLYEPRGSYQLIADAMEEAGAGRLQAAFEALKKKLEAEGLFAEAAKQPLPVNPIRIGVITSPSGAVIRDIVHVLGRRWPLGQIRLYPVPVQGDDAAPAIVRAIESANRHGWAQALIVGRGGGSLEDLWAFNEEVVARAVFNSGIPIVSAVGHETDFSICDFVADLRAPTPSAAAEVLSPDQAVIRRNLESLLRQASRRVNDVLARFAQRHDHLATRLAQQDPARRLVELRKQLEGQKERLGTALRRLIPERRSTVSQLHDRLRNAGTRLTPERQQHLQALARTLHAVSPLPTLARGYAVVTDTMSGKAISSVAQVTAGQAITTRVIDGRIQSVVESTSAEKLEPKE